MSCPRAAFFSTDFLAFSQAFVYEELVHHRQWEMEVFALRRMNRSRFPFEPVHAHIPSRCLTKNLEAALYGATTFSPSHFHRLKTGRFSIMHAQFGTGGVFALPYKKLLNIPLIVTFGGYEVPLLQTRRRFHPRYWRYWLASRSLFNSIDRFLPVSRDLARRLIQLGARSDKIHVFSRGINIPEKIHEKQRSPGCKVLMVGRFVEKKGFEYGIRAFARAIHKGTEAKLYLVGEGPLLPAYKKIIQTEGIGDKVEIKSSMSREKLLELMLECDLILVPSVTARNGDIEGTTNVLKEAMAASIPSVITRHGGNQDLIRDGETGYIVEERDDEAMAEKIRVLASNPALRRSMGEQARKFAKTFFSFDRTNAVLENHYNEVCEQTAKASNNLLRPKGGFNLCR